MLRARMPVVVPKSEQASEAHGPTLAEKEIRLFLSRMLQNFSQVGTWHFSHPLIKCRLHGNSYFIFISVDWYKFYVPTDLLTTGLKLLMWQWIIFRAEHVADHMKTHLKVKVFHCPVDQCDAVFDARKLVQPHVAQAHPKSSASQSIPPNNGEFNWGIMHIFYSWR